MSDSGLQSRIKRAGRWAVVLAGAVASVAAAAHFMPSMGVGGLTCDGPCPTTGQAAAVQQLVVYSVVFVVLFVVMGMAAKHAPGRMQDGWYRR